MADARALQLAEEAARAADSIKATDIVALDVSSRLPLTDVFVLATGATERQVDAIVDAVEERLLGVGAKPRRREGRSGARWVLLDFGDIVVHVMRAEDREFYAIEKLWKDCPAVGLDPVAGSGGEAALAAAASA
ncbi:MAG: ribosome silencing factor [Bifidobacteriaceae bacterium]|nr:ribosome silencing factor [Bifidobacteriaceae bacterium]